MAVFIKPLSLSITGIEYKLASQCLCCSARSRLAVVIVSTALINPSHNLEHPLLKPNQNLKEPALKLKVCRYKTIPLIFDDTI